MSKVGQKERATQNRVVSLLKGKLGYDYLGNWEDREGNSNIEEAYLRKFLQEKQGYSETLIGKAIYELRKVAEDQGSSLYDVNKAVYEYLRYGISVKEDAGENKQTVWLINWKEPLQNHFAIAEEVTVKGEHKKRPDIVFYINGIAVGVLELKRGVVSVTEGIRQNLDNQQSFFIRSFFASMQMVMAGNDTEGLRYGTIETSEKYYLKWKEEEDTLYHHLREPAIDALAEEVDLYLDKHLIQFCYRPRFLEMLHNFIVFDRGIKKVCRPNQYMGVKAAQKFINKKEGGIIWHTQGSGKSLTMVWLTKWVLENINDSRVLIITDRTELDEQIEKVFVGIGEQIYRTKSGADLLTELNQKDQHLLCSLVHKFGRGSKEEGNVDEYIKELKKSLPKDFKPKGDLYVFVDECHRTQSGKLHKAMTEILGDALLIGFTGTPLLKTDKQKSIEIFGPYIHTYKFDQAVKDDVVLDLRYEARRVDQNLRSQDKIDAWFNAKTKGLTDYALTELKKRWGTMQKLLSSRDRLSKIVADIIYDMGTKDRLQNGRGNAMLVSGSIYQACKYYEMFQDQGFKKCAIVTSYNPSPKDIKGQSGGEEGVTERLKQYDIYKKMLNGKEPEVFEKEVKKKFQEEPAQMKLLIVVDKLLTGFDAPSATYLYIDKKMQDHGLFQAICRVNRLDGEDKEYGYIIDYKDLFDSIEGSITDYTSEAFENFSKEDVEGLLENRLEKGRQRLEEALESIKALCEPVPHPKGTNDYIRYFCGDNLDDYDQIKEHEQKRVALYKLTVSLIRAYANLANEMDEAGYTAAETAKIKEEVKYYEHLRAEIKLASGDAIDLKAYEPAMRHLIDTYIGAEESKVISAFDDMTLVEMIVERGEDAVNVLPESIRTNPEAMAETIENNIRKVIIDERPTNPKYFEKMSVLLNELVEQRKQEAEDYAAHLKKLIELTKKVKKPSTSSHYPPTVDTQAKRSLYDNLGQDENLAIMLDAQVKYTKKDNWRSHPLKRKEVKKAIEKILPDEMKENIEDLFKIVEEQKEY